MFAQRYPEIPPDLVDEYSLTPPDWDDEPDDPDDLERFFMAADGTIQCAVCGEFVELSDLANTADGECICRECYLGVTV